MRMNFAHSLSLLRHRAAIFRPYILDSPTASRSRPYSCYLVQSHAHIFPLFFTPCSFAHPPLRRPRPVIVKSTSGPRYVVGCRRKVDRAKLAVGTRVALDMTTLTIMRRLPREVDPSGAFGEKKNIVSVCVCGSE